MTTEEQDRIVGAMVRERSDLRRTIACLEHKVSQAKSGLSSALNSLNLASQGDFSGIEGGLTYPNAEELAGNVEKLRQANAKFAKLNDLISVC